LVRRPRTLIYTSHFIATPVWPRFLLAAAMLEGFISRVIVLSLAGLVTYVLFRRRRLVRAREGVIEPVSVRRHAMVVLQRQPCRTCSARATTGVAMKCDV